MTKTLDFYINEGKTISFASQQSYNVQFAKQPQLQTYIENNIKKISQQTSSLDFAGISKLISELTYRAVTRDNDAFDNLNSVGWHMVMLCHIYKGSLSIVKDKSITEIFISSWTEYFTRYGKLLEKKGKKEKLSESILRLHKRKGSLYIPDIEAEVINFTCLDLFQNNKTEIFDFVEYVREYSYIAKELFKEYNDSHAATAEMSVLTNMEWQGMRDFLKKYYLENHGILITV